MVCSGSTDCAEQAKCDGKKATCPTPPPKPDIVTDCQNKMKVCINGVSLFLMLFSFASTQARSTVTVTSTSRDPLRKFSLMMTMKTIKMTKTMTVKTTMEMTVTMTRL